MIHVEVELIVRRPLDAVWAWWTDFGNVGDESRVSHGFTSSRRRVERLDANGVAFTDASMGSTIRREVVFGALHEFHESARGGARFESDWKFEAVGASRTRITRKMDVKAKALEPFGALAVWGTRRVVLHDLRAHARACENDLPS